MLSAGACHRFVSAHPQEVSHLRAVGQSFTRATPPLAPHLRTGVPKVAWFVFSYPVAMKLPGSYHSCWSQGVENIGRRIWRRRTCQVPVPAWPAPLRAVDTWQGHLSVQQGRAFPFRQVLCPALPSSRLVGATPFWVLSGRCTPLSSS